MRTVFHKRDHLFLVSAEQAVQLPADKKGEVGEGPERAVADENIAGTEFGMQLRYLAGIMRSQGSCQHFEQEASAGMKQSQHMSDGKTAAWLLVARLAERPLQVRCIRHAEAGSVYMKRAMAAPTRVVEGRLEGAGDAFEQRG